MVLNAVASPTPKISVLNMITNTKFKMRFNKNNDKPA